MLKHISSVRSLCIGVACGLALIATVIGTLVVQGGSAHAAQDPLINTTWAGYNGFEYTVNAARIMVISKNTPNPNCYPLGWRSFISITYTGTRSTGERTYSALQIQGSNGNAGCPGVIPVMQPVVLVLSANGQSLRGDNNPYLSWNRVAATVVTYVHCKTNAQITSAHCDHPAKDFGSVNGSNWLPTYPTLPNESCSFSIADYHTYGVMTCVSE